ncbi:MAG: NAD(P)H-dependent oxidoreductase subunit E [Coriobacteriia bacterium]|nr:NAD(P)H-dependent oxidoreductase subunit E [Coriobacteriia bacterium]
MTHDACTCERDTEAVDLTALDAILARHEADSGALIPVLQEAQHAYGYLPRAVLAAIAHRRDTPFAEVYGVATFYSQFHMAPRGKVIVRICTGTACHVAGAPEVMRAIADELNTDVGATSEDMQFTIEAVACVGCCGLAPVVVVDEHPNGQLDSGKARKLAKQLLREAKS